METISTANSIFFGFILILLSCSVNAQQVNQQDSNFNRIFYEAATKLSAVDMGRALFVADSLFKKSETNLQKIKSLMLLATLHQRKGEISTALINAVNAEKLATEEKNENWQIRISGFLSTTFRDIGLNEQGIKYLEIAKKANEKLKSPTIQSFLNQEQAYYFIDEKKYSSAIKELKEAAGQYDKIPDESKDAIFIATTYQMLGNCHFNLNDLNKARENYEQSLILLKGTESELKGFNYLGMGKIELTQKNVDSAFKYFSLAESIASKSENFDLKLNTYKNLVSYYQETGNISKASYYTQNYSRLDKIQSNLTQKISNQLIREFGEQSEKDTTSLILLKIFSVFIVTLLIIFILESIKRNKIGKNVNTKKIIDDQLIIPLFQANIKFDNEAESESDKSSAKPPKKNKVMSIEAEEKLLNKLKKLEAGHFFTQKEISLSALAVKLNTNQKYLSYIINKHKEKDFNNYINELRINYIIQKLQNEEQYLNYKIAFLAEESGFSSHSKFTAVFKNLTGLAPSAFIEQIKKDVFTT